ncbi:hypothetical protein J4Q44_G00362990 [Coregonus suidteri]|uniref:Sm domain-containing protein n=1 Tax=Coregonus suidteri TaxID=861788 RepID=A0AAN8KL30_9TELE
MLWNVAFTGLCFFIPGFIVMLSYNKILQFQGGREASGVLKGFDPLLNLVLDSTIEYLRDPDDQFKLTEDTRQLGLVVCRGTSVVLICPQDVMEAIPNPFIQQQDG